MSIRLHLAQTGPVPAALRAALRVPMFLFLILVFALVQPSFISAEDSVKANNAIIGTIFDADGQALANESLVFWMDSDKVGSATTDSDGRFEFMPVTKQGDGSALSVVQQTLRVTSDHGQGDFVVEKGQTLSVYLSSTGVSRGGFFAEMPVWLRSFFALILPVVVLAIIVFGIRNRRRET